MNKKRLAQAIFSTVVFMGASLNSSFVLAENVEGAQEFRLAEIVINGDRYIAGQYVRATNNLGILGEVELMDSPISVGTFSEKAVDSFMSSSEGLSKMLALMPSVQKNSDVAVDTVRIRGFNDDGRGFSINGIPGMQAMTRQSSNYIGSIDVIEGPSTGITGSGAHSRDGGTININSKKAEEEPINKVILKYHSKSAFEQNVDVSKRSGEDNKYGVRINASNVDGERSIDNWNLRQKNIYINMDQRDEKSTTNFLFGYTDTDSEGRPYGFNIDSAYVGNQLPKAPDGSINHNPEWRRDQNTNLVMTLNHEQKLNEHLRAFINAGHFKQDWFYYTGFSKTILNEQGDFKASSDNYSLLEKRDYVQLGLRGDFTTGSLNHNYSVGIDRTWHYYGGAKDYKEESGWTGNIYVGDPGNWTPPSFSQSEAYYGTKTRVSGWSIMDSISTENEKLNILVGLNGKDVKSDKYKPDGSHKSKIGNFDDIAPSFGINYSFNPGFAVYANHTEEFVQGTIVGSSYANQGEVLDPYKTKQLEIGIKAKTGDVFHRLSYFDIKKADTQEIMLPGANKPTLTSNGERRHKGIEYMLTGSVADKWNLIGGCMYLDAKSKNGKKADGVPEWSANVGLEYEASDDFTAFTRFNYIGDSTIKDESFDVDGYFTMDLGLKYNTLIKETPVKFSATCYNLFDKAYWAPSNNTLHNGSPRTFMLSAEIDL